MNNIFNDYDFNCSSLHWQYGEISPASFTCSFCGNKVTSDKGIALVEDVNSIPSDTRVKPHKPASGVYLCINCYRPTFVFENEQFPEPGIGETLTKLPDDINSIYEEARDCYSVRAYTGVTLLCRKLLMHVAVNFGAKKGDTFVHYIEFLNDKGYITATSRNWVDKIRSFGNEANHKIDIETSDRAKMILQFTEMILKCDFEYPEICPEVKEEKNK